MTKYLTAAEAAQMCRITRRSIYKLTHEGILKGYKLGGTILYLESEIKAAMKVISEPSTLQDA